MRTVILLMMIAINLVFAQTYQFDWTRQGGGADDDELYGLTTTADGYYYVAGSFFGAFSLGDTVLNSAGEGDIYVAKYTRESELVWAKRFGGEFYDLAISIDTDKSGNVYAAGFVVSEDGESNLDTDGWIVALTSVGQELWTERFTAAQNDLIIDIAVGVNDVLYITGEYSGPGEIGGYRLEEFGETDMFLAAYSFVNGRYEWVEAAGGSGYDSGINIEAAPDGELIWAGYYTEEARMFERRVASEGYEDIFVMKLEEDGSVNWLATAGGEMSDIANDVSIDPSGNVLVTGSFEGAAQFDGVTVKSSGASDIYLAKYNSEGAIQWVRQAGGREDDEALSVATDEYGNSYLTGGFEETAWFDNTALESVGAEDLFLARYDANGSLVSVGSEGGEQLDAGTQIAIDAQGATVLAGVFESEADFGDTTLVSGGALDIFISRLSASDVTGIEPVAGSVQDFQLHANYPNPFNPTTRIGFTLKKAAEIKLTIYNLLGEQVRTLYKGSLSSGLNEVAWDGRDDSGNPVTSGQYVYQLKVDNEQSARRMILLK